MYYGPRVFYGFDSTYLLIILGMLLCMGASFYLKRTFSVYRQVRSSCGLTGAEVARRILQYKGITNVTVEPISGELTDHYDPRTKTVRLSEPIYNKTSIAAISVAAHECGHAVQDAVGYEALNFRSLIFPAANFGSTLAWPLFFIGLIASMKPLLIAGILLFSFAVLFQLVTLPVEINASRRAMKILVDIGIVSPEERYESKKVLTAAALTYVAALASSILQLLRLVLIYGDRNNDN